VKSQTFGQRVRLLRQLKNLSQRELAERVAARLKEDDGRGFDFTYLSKIENDRMLPPSTAAIIHLAKELGANEDELLALAGKAHPDVADTIKHSEGARVFFRSAKDMNLSEEQWQELSRKLKEEKAK
jgi:HTH-type transcriptional regulator, competence development regulator